MVRCRDKATTYLQRFGYNVVRHPREGIAPLDVIGHQRGTVSVLGRLDQLIAEPGPLPRIITDEVAADINGQATDELHVGIGLSLMKAVLSGFGGGAGINAAFAGARTVQLVFDGVLTDRVLPLDVAKFLNDRVVDSDPLLDQYIGGKGTIYVVTQTVKSAKLEVVAKDRHGTAVELDVQQLQALVGGQVKVDAAARSQGTVTYEGPKPLVFGFQCFEVGFERGEFQLFSSRPGSRAMAAGKDVTNGSILAEDELLEIEGE